MTTEKAPPPADTPPFPGQVARIRLLISESGCCGNDIVGSTGEACQGVFPDPADWCWPCRAEYLLATLAAAQATAQRLAKFEDDELHKSVVRDLPGHPVYAPCALEGCQYDDVATVAQGTARHLSELEDIRRCLRLCPAHELTPMWEDGKSTCLICEYLHAEAAYASLREATQALVTALDLCAPHIVSAFTLNMVHGMKYAGPTFNEELDRLRAVLQGTGPTP